jgi:hypothetical protein
MLPLSPSSSIVLEFTQETEAADDLTVRTFINDQLVDTHACLDKDTCKAVDFSTALGADIDKAALDVPKFCEDTSAKAK